MLRSVIEYQTGKLMGVFSEKIEELEIDNDSIIDRINIHCCTDEYSFNKVSDVHNADIFDISGNSINAERSGGMTSSENCILGK